MSSGALGRAYPSSAGVGISGAEPELTCDDGQEAHLQKLAQHVDEKVRELAASVGQVGETRLLVMASLLIADELYDAYRQIHMHEAGGATEGDGGPGWAAALLEDCAARIDAIARRLAAP